MTTLWAIEVKPINGRGKPWIHYETISRRRKHAWAAFADGGTALWHKTIAKHKRSGLLRAVKVTVQLAKE
jgi:hypothetical protein